MAKEEKEGTMWWLGYSDREEALVVGFASSPMDALERMQSNGIALEKMDSYEISTVSPADLAATLFEDIL